MYRLKIRKETLILAFILVIAFLLRIKQMIPFNSVDERTIGYWIQNLHKDPFPIHIYPMFFLYFHLLLSFIYKTVLVFIGYINSGAEYMANEFSFTFIMETGRIWSALFGTGIVYLVYKTGKVFYNINVGLFAAVLLAFNKLLVLHSHIFKSDILLALILSLYLYLCLKIIKNPTPGIVVVTSFIFGIAISTKYNAIPLILTIFVALFFIKDIINKKNWYKYFGAVPLGTLAGFLLSSPNWIIHPVSNLKRFIPWYLGGGQNQQWGIKAKGDILFNFFKDFTVNFWPVMIVIFFIGILTILIKRNKNDIVIGVFFTCYVLTISTSGFYGDRMGLPVYSAISLIIAKTIFFDLKKFLESRNKSKIKIKHFLKTGTFNFIIWGLIIIYGIINTGDNIKLLNLLKTRSKTTGTSQYRMKHSILADKYNIVSQHFTPRIKDDIRMKRNFVIKRKRGKHKGKIIHFLQGDYDVYKNIKNGKENLVQASIKLENFLPFYRIEKPRLQHWDTDFILLYKASADILSLPFKNNPLCLPRNYSQVSGTTNFPLQKYEKNPGFGKFKNGIFTQWLYSKNKIKEISIHLFSPSGKIDLKLNINNIELNIRENSSNYSRIFKTDKIQPLKLYFDNVYFIKAISSLQNELYIVINPSLYDQNNISDIKFSLFNQISKDIPLIFSNISYPVWVKEYYKKTGTDLPLLAFINTKIIFQNKDMRIENYSSDFFPLDPGHYKLILKGEKLLNNSNYGSNILLEYILVNNDQKVVKEINIKTDDISKVDLRIKKDISFIKIKLTGLRSNNYILKEISIMPDYKKIIINKSKGDKKGD